MQNSSRRDVLTRGGAAAALAVTGAVVGGADGAMAFAEPSKELDRLQRLDHLDVFCASNGLLVAAVVIDGKETDRRWRPCWVAVGRRQDHVLRMGRAKRP